MTQLQLNAWLLNHTQAEVIEVGQAALRVLNTFSDKDATWNDTTSYLEIVQAAILIVENS